MNRITKIKNNLYLGNGIHVQKETDEFKKLGINVIINCCDEIVHEHNEKYIIEHFPINDDGIDGSFVTYLEKSVETINSYLLQGKNVYVHCVQGISRSVAITIYYLMKYDKMSFDDAYFKLKMQRSCISPHINFVRELKKRVLYKNDDPFLTNEVSNI